MFGACFKAFFHRNDNFFRLCSPACCHGSAVLISCSFCRVAEGCGFNEKSLNLFQVKIMSIPGLFLHLANISPQVQSTVML